jgi:hypothetical protein
LGAFGHDLLEVVHDGRKDLPLIAIPDDYSVKMQAFFATPEIGALAMLRLIDIYVPLFGRSSGCVAAGSDRRRRCEDSRPLVRNRLRNTRQR